MRKASVNALSALAQYSDSESSPEHESQTHDADKSLRPNETLPASQPGPTKTEAAPKSGNALANGGAVLWKKYSKISLQTQS